MAKKTTMIQSETPNTGKSISWPGIASYGVRTIDVPAAEELCVPGFEYHYIDDTEDRVGSFRKNRNSRQSTR